MLFDLHAHAPLSGYYNQDPHWGPFFEKHDDGHIRLRVGEWILTLGSPERRKFVKEGGVLHVEEFFKSWDNPAGRLKSMDAANQNAQVLSVPSHCYMYWADPAFANPFSTTVNNTLAEYCAKAPGRLYMWATAALQDPPSAAKEIRRAVKELGAVGLSAGGSNFGGLEFDDPKMDPVWEALCDLDLPMFVHGYNQSVTWGDKANTDKYETTAIVGMNYDETKCFWYLICGGVLDRFPKLKVYITHAGGFAPYQLGRMAQTIKNLDVVHNKKDLMEYMPNFWFDPELHELPFRQALVEIIGADQLVYGTNFGGSDAIRGDLTEGLRVSPEDLEKIRYKTACKLLHIDPASLGQVQKLAAE